MGFDRTLDFKVGNGGREEDWEARKTGKRGKLWKCAAILNGVIHVPSI